MIYCCDEFMKVLDFKHGQNKCKCEVCGRVAYYQPYGSD
jgi:hypothetical protein